MDAASSEDRVAESGPSEVEADPNDDGDSRADEKDDYNDQDDYSREEGENETDSPRSEVSYSMPTPPEACPIPIAPGCSAHSYHPVQRLQHRASVLSGVTLNRAFAVDDKRLGVTISEYHFLECCERFYTKIEQCPEEDEWFRSMFFPVLSANMTGDETAAAVKDQASNLSDFLVQRFGGPSYYSDRKGRPNLIGRHKQIEVSQRTADKWLGFMLSALGEMEEAIELADREILADYFKYTCFFLVASQEDMWAMSTQKTDDDLPPHTHDDGI